MRVVQDILESAQREIDFLAPSSLLSLTGTYAIEHAIHFIQNGGVLRGITAISHDNIDEARMRLDVGEDLRHSSRPSELFMFVGDKRQSISAINVT